MRGGRERGGGREREREGEGERERGREREGGEGRGESPASLDFVVSNEAHILNNKVCISSLRSVADSSHSWNSSD